MKEFIDLVSISLFIFTLGGVIISLVEIHDYIFYKRK